jgi:hypothetical protein
MGLCKHGTRKTLNCSACAAEQDAKAAALQAILDERTKPQQHLPADPQARKDAPIARGCLDYFPLALAAVAECSRVATEQHHPGQPMHWERGKSTDHADCLVRHLIDRGTLDTDGVRHATKVAWRALALLQTELEEATRCPNV